ncbi:MAG: 7-carboxy-7-deazaguanine synthase QueE [Bacteroidetes bacterium]|nr:7-carboxy-7-deazaguanine synthase QueE [Bacteroidota bacterium]
MEEFYSIQGEGYHTGRPSYFARIGGCDVGCKWCDVKESWNAAKYPPVSTDTIIRHAALYPAKAIVVTGGEPLLYNMDYLCQELHRQGISTFLETSGSSKLSGDWDWICLSPKKDGPPLPVIFEKANELKVIIENIQDFSWAEENAGKVLPSCILYLQPEWSQRATIIPEIVKYIQANPKWKISIQAHKYMRIP